MRILKQGRKSLSIRIYKVRHFVNFEDNSSNPVTFSFDNRDATPVKEIVGAGSQGTNTPIYNLEGMRIGNTDQAPRIYIVNGKKVIKK